MTDLLDTIHDLQREVKALKAIGDTSGAVSSSVATASTAVPAYCGQQYDGHNLNASIGWSKAPGSIPFELRFRTASNNEVVLDLSAQALMMAEGDVNVMSALFWRLLDNGTPVITQEAWDSDPNDFTAGIPCAGAIGGGWRKDGDTVSTYGGGNVGTMSETRILAGLTPHHTYTVSVQAVYAVPVHDGSQHYNDVTMAFNSITVKVTNVVRNLNA